ncbi:hypothetical protein niasHS_003889 [Heterodera schachtii]|uniref:Secreted protein n=1 Tax=Heterodera schachtii TaxID=97005 RepID=A0ABD2K3G8_HETSC
MCPFCCSFVWLATHSLLIPLHSFTFIPSSCSSPSSVAVVLLEQCVSAQRRQNERVGKEGKWGGGDAQVEEIAARQRMHRVCPEGKSRKEKGIANVEQKKAREGAGENGKINGKRRHQQKKLTGNGIGIAKANTRKEMRTPS